MSVVRRLKASWRKRGLIPGTLDSARAWLNETDEVLQLERTIGDGGRVSTAWDQGRLSVACIPAEGLVLPEEFVRFRTDSSSRRDSAGHLAFTAVNGDRLVGVTILGVGGCYCHGRRRFRLLPTGWGYSYATHVSIDARGLGIGACLLDAMERKARGLGLETLYAIIAPSNEASLRLYRGAGYRDTGVWKFRRTVGVSRAAFVPYEDRTSVVR